MDNNVIASVNLMMVYTLHNVGHKNNLPCLAVNVNAIAGTLFAFYREQDKRLNKRAHYYKCIPVDYCNMI